MLRDVTEYDLVSPNLLGPFTQSCEFWGKAVKNLGASELDRSISDEYEHHAFDESDDIYLLESNEKEVERNSLEFNDDIPSVEFVSFSCGSD